MPYDNNQINTQVQPQDAQMMGAPTAMGQEGGFPQPQPEEPMMQVNSAPIGEGNPYFMGDEALIRFSSGEEGYGPSVYWLVNKKDHTIRPFESDMALDAAFGDDLKAALQNAVTIAPPVMDPSGNITEGVLADFSLLGPEYAIKEDGTSKPLSFSPHQLKGRYGKSIDENAEGMGTEVIDGFLELLKKNEDKTKIPANFINKLKNDSQLMAFYISAMAYGEYSLSDVYSDISQRFNNKD